MALAAVTFTGLWWLNPSDVGPAPERLVLTPFEHIVTDPAREGGDGQSYILGLWNRDAHTDPGSALYQVLYAAGGPLAQTLTIVQPTPFVVLMPVVLPDGSHESTMALQGSTVAHLTAAEPGPRLLVDGFNATRVTAYIFDAEGVLHFTNANASDAARFKQAPGGITPLPNGTWYLGNGVTPEGQERLPLAAQAILNQLRPLLVGLPEGGVATTQTNALVSFYGTLFVTIRVDELVYAP